VNNRRGVQQTPRQRVSTRARELFVTGNNHAMKSNVRLKIGISV
jgi:hypothetical protein